MKRSELIAKVKEISIIDYAERNGITVDKKGFCCCPFHNEKTASLKIYPGGKSFCCFGCHKGGDIINFARNLTGLDFNAAVKQIAEQFGIQTDKQLSDAERLSIAVKAAAEKAKREKAETEKQRFETEYWTAFEKWLENEREIIKQGPSEAQEEFSAEFCEALNKRFLLREAIEQMEDKRGLFYGQFSSGETIRNTAVSGSNRAI